MRVNPRELMSQAWDLEQRAGAMLAAAKASTRGGFSATEATEHFQLISEAGRLRSEIASMEGDLSHELGLLTQGGSYRNVGGVMEPVVEPAGRGRAPGVSRMGAGEVEAMAAYIRSGDRGALRESRASNDTIMNVTTGADGLYAVPTDLHSAIIARRDESMLARKLGVRQIGPGVGKTMDVALDAEADLDMVSTAEQDDAHAQVYDRDAPALGTKAFTYVKYTKKVELTEEVLEDTSINLLEFVIEYVGRSQAARHNYGLVTEVCANGTALKTFAAASAIAAGEPEAIAYNATLAPYLDEPRSVAWVMQPPTFGGILGITGNVRQYAEVATQAKQSLLSYPVLFSSKVAAVGASAKSILFGDFYSVGLRESPRMGFIRDDISTDGLVILKFRMRFAYGVVASEGIGYAVHPSA